MCGGDITMEYVPTYEQALAKVKQFINNDPSKCGTIVNYIYQFAAHLKDPRKTHPQTILSALQFFMGKLLDSNKRLLKHSEPL
jgi:hypothetical protein